MSRHNCKIFDKLFPMIATTTKKISHFDHIPGGVNSPVRAMKSVSEKPLIIKRSFQDTLVDVDDNHYIDYCNSWGALILGHSPQVVVDQVKEHLDQGTTVGLSTPIEAKIAEKICYLISSVEKVRFVSSGTEATMSAVRLARGFTGRNLVVKFTGGYHGHADLFLADAGSALLDFASEPSSKGVPHGVIKDVVSLPYNDIAIAREFLQNNQVACVIIEPIAGNMGVVPARFEFLEMLREETQKQGALLIFDEIISGFRVGLRGAQGLLGIEPDLTCLGKIIGGGFPAAAFGGRADIMDHLAPLGEVFQAGTLSGNPIAMLAGYTTLKELEDPLFYSKLQGKVRAFLDPIETFIKSESLNMSLQQVGSMFTLFFGVRQVTHFEDTKRLDLPMYRKFFQYLLNRGIFIPPSQYEAWFISSAHSEKHLDKTQKEILNFLKTLVF